MSATPPARRHPFYVWPRPAAQQLSLDGAWEITHTPRPADPLAPDTPPGAEAAWVEVSVPGMVQWQWYQAGQGPHPYTGQNSREYVWMEARAWWYRRSFTVPADWRAERVDLVFDGVDHDARFWLDGQELGTHEGMFGGPSFTLTETLRPGTTHELLVRLLPAGRDYGKPPDTSSGRLVKGETFDRWINNPDLMTVGLWQSVRLVATGLLRLERPFVTTRSVSDEAATVRVEVEALAASVEPQVPWVKRHGAVTPVVDPAYRLAAAAPEATLTVEIRDANGQVVATHRQLANLSAGREWLRAELVVPRPRLWQPNGLGEPYRYHCELTLMLDDQAVDRLSVPLGIRTLAWVDSAGPRSQDHWMPWLLRANGQDVFLRGVNWMPLDLLSLQPARYRWFLTLAREAGIQMLRVWGGGLIETETFYDLCDELGLLVWQDFPLNSGWLCHDMPPDVWEDQVMWTVFRLRSRPSLAVWCGGNEFDPYAVGNAAVVGIMERNVVDLDGTRPFVRGCPDAGDVHPYPDWDTVWYYPQFQATPSVSEWGSHALPTLPSLAEFMPQAELDRPLGALTGLDEAAFTASHPTLRHHWAEFHPGRIPRTIRRAELLDDMSDPSLADLVTAVQVGAGEVYTTVAGAFRANYPVTTLVMPWTYNRPWPSVGMQLVDHAGRPTAGYYAVRQAYHPSLITLVYAHEALAPGETMPVTVRVVHDGEGDLPSATVRLAVLDASLHEMATQTWSVAVPAGPAPLTVGEWTITAPQGETAFFLRADLVDQAGQVRARSVRWLRTLHRLAEAEARAAHRAQPGVTEGAAGAWLRRLVAEAATGLAWRVVANAAPSSDRLTRLRVQVENTGQSPAVFVHWQWARPDWLLLAEDSYFWLEPGETRQLTLTFAPADGVSAWPYPAADWQPALLADLSLAAWNAPPVGVTP